MSHFNQLHKCIVQCHKITKFLSITWWFNLSVLLTPKWSAQNRIAVYTNLSEKESGPSWLVCIFVPLHHLMSTWATGIQKKTKINTVNHQNNTEKWRIKFIVCRTVLWNLKHFLETPLIWFHTFQCNLVITDNFWKSLLLICGSSVHCFSLFCSRVSKFREATMTTTCRH